VNNLLQVNLSKVEQCASGAVYCQILDACHPGTVGMRKVNWMAKADHEYVPNYKVLQASFDKNHIQKHVDVDKLIRAKYQDNLEFLQWMKCYWDREGGGDTGYNPMQAREGRPLPPWARPQGLPLAGGEKENMRPLAEAASKARMGAVKAVNRAPAAARSTLTSKSPRPAGSLQAGMDDKAAGDFKAKILAQQDEMEDLRTTLEGLERERDFYFKKLRHVEALCSTLQAEMNPGMTPDKIISDIQGILYAEDEDEEEEECMDPAVGLPIEPGAEVPPAY